MRAKKLLVSATAAASLSLAISIGIAGPASATTTVTISGTQGFDTNVYWSTGRYNSYSTSRMKIDPYKTISCGSPHMVWGARWSPSPVASFGKTTSLEQTQSSWFYDTFSGSNEFTNGTFYITSYLDDDIGSNNCGSTDSWTATLKYDNLGP